MLERVTLPQLVGNAAGTVVSTAPLNAQLVAMHIASNCAGTITLSNTDAPVQTLMTLTGGAGTAWYYPVVQNCATGGGGITGIYDRYPLDGYIQLVMNAAGTVDVTLVIDRD